MATVDVFTADATQAILDGTIVDATIDGSGHLILTTHDGTPIDAGAIRGSFDAATTSAAGVVELATDAEAIAGTDATLAVTPHALAAVTGPMNTTISGKQTADADLTTIAGLTATTDNVIQSVGGSWASRTMAQMKAVMSLVKGDVGLGNVDNTTDVGKPVSTLQAAADALKANIASPTFTGVVTAPKIVGPHAALTDIVVDASLGNNFRVTLGGNRTLGAPSNLTDDQILTFEILQDATGSRTLAYNAVYAFGTDIPSPTLTTTASKRDFLTFKYNSTAGKLYCLGVLKGY